MGYSSVTKDTLDTVYKQKKIGDIVFYNGKDHIIINIVSKFPFELFPVTFVISI